jgi:diguanylate cyclase (GGDEF)-like protein
MTDPACASQLSDAGGVHLPSEYTTLREAFDHADQGIVVIDEKMRVIFVNARARDIWKLRNDQCDRQPLFSDFIYNIATAGAYDLSDDELAGYVLRRFETVKNGDPTPIDIRTTCGRTIRAQVTPLPSGGRMLTHVDVTDLVQQADHFRRLASADPLTGLSNRREFLRLAQGEFDRLRRYHAPFAIALLDIDQFKQINDEYGHDVGDRAILHLASIIQHCKRATDAVARLGGDEFSVLLANTSAGEAMKFAERLRATVEFFPLYLNSTPIKLTISIGVAEAADSLMHPEAILKLADERLYVAKRTGRNRCSGPE